MSLFEDTYSLEPAKFGVLVFSKTAGSEPAVLLSNSFTPLLRFHIPLYEGSIFVLFLPLSARRVLEN